jgi:dTDP-4-amino-4,6-dideoxygalactose transaminase
MRMGGLEAASLIVKLKYLSEWNYRRQEIASMYQQQVINTKIKMQVQPEGFESVYHLFVVTTDSRDHLMKYLNSYNIFPGLHYPIPCHLQQAYLQFGYKPGDMSNAEYLSAHCLSLPMYAELDDIDIEYIIDKLNKY